MTVPLCIAFKINTSGVGGDLPLRFDACSEIWMGTFEGSFFNFLYGQLLIPMFLHAFCSVVLLQPNSFAASVKLLPKWGAKSSWLRSSFTLFQSFLFTFSEISLHHGIQKFKYVHGYPSLLLGHMKNSRKYRASRVYELCKQIAKQSSNLHTWARCAQGWSIIRKALAFSKKSILLSDCSTLPASPFLMTTSWEFQSLK